MNDISRRVNFFILSRGEFLGEILSKAALKKGDFRSQCGANYEKSYSLILHQGRILSSFATLNTSEKSRENESFGG